MHLISALYQFFDKYRALLPEYPYKILVGVSGGPDSLSLLHALSRIKDELNIEPEAAHMNHRIRGAEAEEDANFVQNFCARLDLTCHLKAVDVPGMALERRLTLEEAARLARYTWFASLLWESNIPLLLLAHNANDQAETVLMRAIRGTGLRGLAGIPPLGPLPLGDKPVSGVKPLLGRPLLGVWRKDIMDYCVAYDLQPRIDSSNTSMSITRNRVRLELLPLLEESYQHGATNNLVQLAQLARDEEAWLEELTAGAFEQTGLKGKGWVGLKLPQFLASPVALQRRLLRFAYARVAGTLHNLESGHIEQILESLGKPGWKIDLPGSILLQVQPDRLLFKLVGSTPEGFYPLTGEKVLTLPVPGEVALVQGKLVCYYISRDVLEKETWRKAASNEAYLDAGRVGQVLTVRGRKPGEMFKPLGAPGRRKLQDFMVDRKIPAELRDAWTLVVAPAEGEGEPERILWVACQAIGDEFRITPETGRFLVIRFINE